MPWLGLYVHVPFCVARCHYCSFNTAPLDHAALALSRGWLARSICSATRRGRPTSASTASSSAAGRRRSSRPTSWRAILDRLRARFAVAAGRRGHRGVQSRERRGGGPGRLPTGGGHSRQPGRAVPRRRACSSASAACTRRAPPAPGLRGHARGRLRQRERRSHVRAARPRRRWAGRARSNGVLDWEPEHLSAYGLTLDEGSRWGAAGVTGLPAEDRWWPSTGPWRARRRRRARALRDLQLRATRMSRSRHNLVYWRAAEYLAAGPGRLRVRRSTCATPTPSP